MISSKKEKIKSSLGFSLNYNVLQTNSKFYRLNDRINDHIFIANHLHSDTTFAVKRVNLDIATDTELEDIEKEIRITRLVKHENLLPFLSCFLHLNHLWIISPLCDYGSADMLSQPTGLPELGIAFVVRDILHGLEYLHSHGFILRSLRASHILVTSPTGRCMLTGLKYSTSVVVEGKWQTIIHEYPENAKTNLNWLSPELLEQNLLGYNAKSDIYSLGITCCELANGSVPFEDLHPTEMLLDKLTGNYPKPLDSTCTELFNFDFSDLPDEEKSKFQIFKERRFTDSFHSFVVDLCLNSDPHKRPSSSQLLNHSFIKQIKKHSSSTCLVTVLAANNKQQIGKFTVEGDKKDDSSNNSDVIDWDF